MASRSPGTASPCHPQDGRVARGGARRSLVLAGAGTLALALGTALLPGTAAAHGVTTTRFDVPLPLWLLLTGAGATVAATALLVAVGDRRRPTDADKEASWYLFSVSASGVGTLRSLLGGSFLLAVVAVLLAGALGHQVPAGNLATVVTWPIWFHGLALVAILATDPWPTLSPWRTLYRGLVRLEGAEIALLDRGEGSARPLGSLPGWIAVVGFLVLFGVVENLTVIPRSPRLTAALVGGLALAMVLGGVLVGPAWFRRADPLTALYRLLARASPVATSRTATGGLRVRLRPPWRGCRKPVAGVSLAVFAVAMVYTVSFDGAGETRAFRTVLFAVREGFGTGPGTSVLLYAAGLLSFLLLFGTACWLVERLGAGTADRWRDAVLAFAPTILPIAAAYEVAHVYPYVLENLGQLPAVALAPFGVAVGTVSPLAWLPLPAFWASQVLLIVLGHVVAVVAAHRVAIDRYGDPRAATRGHLPLVVAMVGYTALSLWIVSAPVVG